MASLTNLVSYGADSSRTWAKKNPGHAGGKPDKKGIINRTALDFLAFCFLPKSKILLERKVVIIFLIMGNRKIENVNNSSCNFS